MFIKMGDWVRIKGKHKDDPDYAARVNKVTLNGVVVSNMNMPFLGTYAQKFFSHNEVEKL